MKLLYFLQQFANLIFSKEKKGKKEKMEKIKQDFFLFFSKQEKKGKNYE
jgi:hypothetical protein